MILPCTEPTVGERESDVGPSAWDLGSGGGGGVIKVVLWCSSAFSSGNTSFNKNNQNNNNNNNKKITALDLGCLTAKYYYSPPVNSVTTCARGDRVAL